MITINLTAKFIESLMTPNIRTEYFDDDVPGSVCPLLKRDTRAGDYIIDLPDGSSALAWETTLHCH